MLKKIGPWILWYSLWMGSFQKEAFVLGINRTHIIGTASVNLECYMR